MAISLDLVLLSISITIPMPIPIDPRVTIRFVSARNPANVLLMLMSSSEITCDKETSKEK